MWWFEPSWLAQLVSDKRDLWCKLLLSTFNLAYWSSTSQVVEGRRYKPIMINCQHRIVPSEMLDILLRDSQYIRVICTVRPTTWLVFSLIWIFVVTCINELQRMLVNCCDFVPIFLSAWSRKVIKAPKHQQFSLSSYHLRFCVVASALRFAG